MRQIYELIRGLSRSTRLILSGGFLVSIALGLWVQATERNKAYSAFEQLASSVESDVVARFTTTTHALKGAMASMVADRQIGISTSRAQFRAFVEARQVDLDLPGVHGFGFIQPVSRDSLERFIAVEQTDGAPGFAVRQLEDRSHDELYVVKYIEPIARNANAVGLDAGSDPRRRASIEQAIDGGRVAMTEPLEPLTPRRSLRNPRRLPGGASSECRTCD